MLAIHDMFPSDSEIPNGVWLERFGLAALLIVVIAFLPIPRPIKIVAGFVLPVIAYASAQIYWGTVFS